MSFKENEEKFKNCIDLNIEQSVFLEMFGLSEEQFNKLWPSQHKQMIALSVINLLCWFKRFKELHPNQFTNDDDAYEFFRDDILNVASAYIDKEIVDVIEEKLKEYHK